MKHIAHYTLIPLIHPHWLQFHLRTKICPCSTSPFSPWAASPGEQATSCRCYLGPSVSRLRWEMCVKTGFQFQTTCGLLNGPCFEEICFQFRLSKYGCYPAVANLCWYVLLFLSKLPPHAIYTVWTSEHISSILQYPDLSHLLSQPCHYVCQW